MIKAFQGVPFYLDCLAGRTSPLQSHSVTYDYSDGAIYVRADATFEHVAGVLEELELLYNLLAWPYSEHLVLFEKDLKTRKLPGFWHGITTPADIASKANTSLTNLRLRFLINDPELELRLKSVTVGESFEVSFRGLGKAVKHLLRSIDPSYRRERQEAVRHFREMNRIEEGNAHRLKAIADVDGIIMIHKKLLKAGVITEQEYKDSIHRCIFRQMLRSDILAELNAIPSSQPDDGEQQTPNVSTFRGKPSDGQSAQDSGRRDISPGSDTSPELPPPPC